MKTPRIRFPDFQLVIYRIPDQAKPVKIDTRIVAHYHRHSVFENWNGGFYSGLLYARWSEELGKIEQPSLAESVLAFSTVKHLCEHLLTLPEAKDRKSFVPHLLEGIERSREAGWIGKLPP